MSAFDIDLAPAGRSRLPHRHFIPLLVHHETWRALASTDIRSKYRRTVLGPWWLTASNGIFALIIGTVSGSVMGSEMATYLPYFMVSMTVWTFYSSTLNESGQILISSGGMIKAVNMPISFHVQRMVHRNLIIFLHNLAIIPLVWLVYPWHLGPALLLAIPGLALGYLCISAIALILGMACTRYRDLPPLIAAVTQLLFFISAIIWMPDQVQGGHLLLRLNPISALLAIVRDPILGRTIHGLDWAIAMGFTAVMLAGAALVYGRYNRRIVFWV